MKKLTLLISMVSAVVFANAQVNFAEYKDASQKRVEQITELYAKFNLQALDTSLTPNVIKYAEDVHTLALSTISTTETLENMYSRSIGETDENGVTDVSVKKPTLDEWASLLASITASSASLVDASSGLSDAKKDVEKITEQVKKAKGPSKIKISKKAKDTGQIMDLTASVIPILTDELSAQVKAVNEIVDIIKSGKNL